jgi:hypothetical protein
MDSFIDEMQLTLNDYTDEERYAASIAAARYLINKWKAEADNECSMKEQAEQARAVAMMDLINANKRAAIAESESKDSKFILRLVIATFVMLILVAYFRINFICR